MFKFSVRVKVDASQSLCVWFPERSCNRKRGSDGHLSVMGLDCKTGLQDQRWQGPEGVPYHCTDVGLHSTGCLKTLLDMDGWMDG